MPTSSAGQGAARHVARCGQWLSICWLALAAATAAASASAATSAPPSAILEVLPHARLAGEGTLRFWGFHIYDAKLWVGEGGFRATDPDAAPFALDVKYARHFTGEAIAKTAVEEFERMGWGDPDKRERWYQLLLKVIPDVEPDQHLTGVFLPGQGMRLYSNGTLLGNVDDPEFSHAFFSIWLDPRTKAPDLREQLLENAAPGA